MVWICGFGRSCGSSWNSGSTRKPQLEKAPGDNRSLKTQIRSFKWLFFWKNIWWGNRNWKFSGRSGLKIFFFFLGFRGTFWNHVCVYAQYQPTLQNMHKIFNLFSFNKLNTKWGQWQGRLRLKQLVLGVKCTKVCSPLSARKFLLFHVLCHHFCVSCTAQAWPSSFTPVWPFQGELEPFSLIKALH